LGEVAGTALAIPGVNRAMATNLNDSSVLNDFDLPMVVKPCGFWKTYNGAAFRDAWEPLIPETSATLSDRPIHPHT